MTSLTDRFKDKKLQREQTDQEQKAKKQAFLAEKKILQSFVDRLNGQDPIYQEKLGTLRKSRKVIGDLYKNNKEYLDDTSSHDMLSNEEYREDQEMVDYHAGHEEIDSLLVDHKELLNDISSQYPDLDITNIKSVKEGLREKLNTLELELDIIDTEKVLTEPVAGTVDDVDFEKINVAEKEKLNKFLFYYKKLKELRPIDAKMYNRESKYTFDEQLAVTGKIGSCNAHLSHLESQIPVDLLISLIEKNSSEELELLGQYFKEKVPSEKLNKFIQEFYEKAKNKPKVIQRFVELFKSIPYESKYAELILGWNKNSIDFSDPELQKLLEKGKRFHSLAPFIKDNTVSVSEDDDEFKNTLHRAYYAAPDTRKKFNKEFLENSNWHQFEEWTDEERAEYEEIKQEMKTYKSFEEYKKNHPEIISINMANLSLNSGSNRYDVWGEKYEKPDSSLDDYSYEFFLLPFSSNSKKGCTIMVYDTRSPNYNHWNSESFQLLLQKGNDGDWHCDRSTKRKKT